MNPTAANGNNTSSTGTCRLFSLHSYKKIGCNIDRRRLVHSIKVGIALVLVSLLYLVNSMFEHFRENAMWAIMTVVVMFEFYAGATLGKGINRGIGTVLGGGLGCLASIMAEEIGGIGNLIIVASSVFVFGVAATYCRLVPRLKKRHDYGFLIAILTFNLVAVSGVRVDKVFELAESRLATIGMGFGVCILVSLLVCPIWASDELHYSTASKFHKLASSIQGCLDEYFKVANEKENNQEAGDSDYVQACKSLLSSKSNDESLANFARWEPWHGKFGLYYPWDKYLQVGEHLRELAATILSLKECLQSRKQPSVMQRQTLKDPCESFILSVGWVLEEVGEGIKKMELCQPEALITPKLQSMKLRLSPGLSCCKMYGVGQTDEALAITTLNFLLLEIVEKVQTLAIKVEELGRQANFPAKKGDV